MDDNQSSMLITFRIVQHTQSKYSISLLFLLILGLVTASDSLAQREIRQPVDPIGYATRAGQMDSVVKRIYRQESTEIENALYRAGVEKYTSWKVAICPHDDYAYVGWIYPAVLRNMKASTIIIFGVAHQAEHFGIQNKLIFDDFTAWRGPYGNIQISPLRDAILKNMDRKDYVVHDSLQQTEHSIEALLPFLQYYYRDVQIVPILVPNMPFERMNQLAKSLTYALKAVMDNQEYKWGGDFSFLISSDAVHYGNEGWNGANYAPYGVDSSSYRQAIKHDYEIISNTLDGPIKEANMKSFTQYVIQVEDYKASKWPWCGRYSIPLGLLTAYYLNYFNHGDDIKGYFLGYKTSLQPPIDLKSIGLGTTAPANLHHWVGYMGIGYR